MRTVFLRLAAYCVGVVVAVALCAATFVYWIERREVGAAKQMVEDASQLRIQTSDSRDVLAFSHKYHGDANSTGHGLPCIESDCLVVVARHSGDQWERHPKLADVEERISRRQWRYYILMWVKDGRLTAIEQQFSFLTPKDSSFNLWSVDTVATTVCRPGPGLDRNPFYRLHRVFAAYPPPTPDLVHFRVWVDPAATQEREMLRLNLDCIVHLSGCKGVRDMAPAAWRAYETDQRLVDANESRWRDEIANDPECR